MLCHLGTHLHPTERSYKTRPGNPVVPDVDFGSSGEMEWRSQPTERPRAYGPSEPAQGPRTGLKAELQPSQASGARQRLVPSSAPQTFSIPTWACAPAPRLDVNTHPS